MKLKNPSKQCPSCPTPLELNAKEFESLRMTPGPLAQTEETARGTFEVPSVNLFLSVACGTPRD